jgi:biopolymer transport protein ExbB
MSKNWKSLITSFMLVAFTFICPFMLSAQDDGAGDAGGGGTSALKVFEHAGWIGWVLLLFVFVGFGLFFYFLIYYSRSKLMPEGLYAQLDQLLEEGEYEDALQLCSVDESMLAKVMAPAIRDVEIGYEAMHGSLQLNVDEQATLIHQLVGWLNTIAALAPMVGLFGTISGMITTFEKIASSSGAPSPTELAGGIQEALATTFIGLCVAIPFLMIYSFSRDKADRMVMEVAANAENLIIRFKGEVE